MSRKIEVGTETFVRFWLVIIGFGIALYLLNKAFVGLLIVGAAIFLAIAISPLARKFDKLWGKKKERRGLSAVAAVLSVVLVVGLVVAIVGPMVVNETVDFLKTAPETVSEAIEGFGGLDNFGAGVGIENLGEQIGEWLTDFSKEMLAGISGSVVTSVSTAANILTGVTLTIVLAILFLIEGPGLLDNFWKMLSSKKDSETVKVWRRVVEKMAGVITKYVSGQLSVAVLDGVVTTLVVMLMSLIFGFSMGLALPMGLITMVLYMIPMFGPIFGCIIVALLLFFSSPVAGVIFVVWYAFWQQIENNVIAPKIQGKGLSLPTVAILAAITIGMYMFGLVGAIISIPIAGCIKVLVEEYPNLKAVE